MSEVESFVVSDIKEHGKTKKAIFFNNGKFAFTLYNNELRKFKLAIGKEISQENFENIKLLLLDRAKNRALHIVTRNDITESVLRDKLRQGLYPEIIIDDVVQFMYQHKFLDDYRYASNYIYFKSESKSRRQIELYLKQKGIASDIIENACVEFYGEHESSERDLIKNLIVRKKVDVESLDYENKGKLIAYLARKGFDYDIIQAVLNEMKQGF